MDNSYGAGGGFMRSSQGGGSPGDGGSKRSGPASLRPVTIHQILNASQAHPDAELYIDGKEVKDITFVACVRNVNSTSTHLGYLVEDGTGQIDVRRWIDGNVEEAVNEFEINTYVRVLGTIKVFHNKRSIHCSRMRAVEDKNEVLYHSVECVHSSLYFTRGPPGRGNAEAGIKNEAGANMVGDNPYGAAANGNGSTSDLLGEFPPQQRKLMQFILDVRGRTDTEEGVNVNHIIRSAGVPEALARRQVQQLVDDGHLYTTFNDDHVLPTSL